MTMANHTTSTTSRTRQRREEKACRKGYGGPNCNTKCELDCNHHGNCVFDAHQQQQCQCHPGYEGKLCQYSAHYCGGETAASAQLVCLHGSICVRREHDPSTYRCGCPPDDTDCQNRRSAAYCNPTPPHIEYEGGMAAAAATICLNGGICKEVVTAEGRVLPSCECSDLFTGPRCENLLIEQPKTTQIETTQAASPVKPFVILLIVTLVVSILAILLFVGRQMKRSRKKRARDGILRTNIQGFRTNGQDPNQNFQSNLEYVLEDNKRDLNTSMHSTDSGDSTVLATELAKAGLFRNEETFPAGRPNPLTKQRSKLQLSNPSRRLNKKQAAVIRRKARSRKIKEREVTPKKQRMHFV